MNKTKKRINFAPGTLTAPLPPVMATVGSYESANIITIGWTGILASTPPRTYISVRPTRHSHSMLGENGEFVINLPSVELARAVDYCGIYTGAKVDKFEKCGLTKLASEKVSPPTIAECPIAIECRVCEVVNMGSHDVFIADIVSVSCREDVVEEGGRMRFDKADLLAYAHGEYYSLGEIVGRFGFSTDKRARKSAPGKSQSGKQTDRGSTEKGSGKKSRGVSSEAGADVNRGSKRVPFYKAVARSSAPRKRSDKGASHGKRSSKGGSKDGAR